MIYFKIALLNIKKHSKRSLLIITAITISVMVMFLVSGMIDGMRKSFFNNILQGSGHLQIHIKGYKDKTDQLSLDYIIENADEILQKIKNTPGIITAEKIFQFGTLLVNREKNLPLIGIGTNENPHFFSDVRQGMLEGNFSLKSGNILVSSENASMLDLELGDFLDILTEDSEGIPSTLAYEVAGIFKSNSLSFDKNFVFFNHHDIEELLYTPEASKEIRVLIQDKDQADRIKLKLQQSLQGMNLEIETWQEIHSKLYVIIELFDVFIVFMDFFVLIVAAMVITNAILMNMFERTREFGTLRAMGLKRCQLFGLIMTEGSVLGLFGSFIGLVLGTALVFYLSTQKIDIGAVMDAFNLGNTLNFSLSFSSSLINVITGFLIALAGSLYAAMVNARMKLVDALAFV